MEDSSDDGWETLSETEGDWEEQLILMELNDVPNVQELFAVQPDDFLRFQKKTFYRPKFQPSKQTHPKISLKFHNFHSSSPALQIGHRYFACRWEEPTGSALIFRKRDAQIKTELRDKNNGLKNIVPDPQIPWDRLFGKDQLVNKQSYEAVGLADKVLKTELLEAGTKKLNKIPITSQFSIRRPDNVKIPIGYTAADLLAGEYKPKRTYVRKRKIKREAEIIAQPGNNDAEENKDNTEPESVNEEMETTE